VNRVQSRRLLSGAIWAAPRRISANITLRSFSSPEEAEGQKESEGLRPEETILLAKGEGLFKFPEKSKSKISPCVDCSRVADEKH